MKAMLKLTLAILPRKEGSLHFTVQKMVDSTENVKGMLLAAIDLLEQEEAQT